VIARAHITAWRAHAPWPSDAQIEQDLVLSRALVEIFRHPMLCQALAFRGGTALHKLFLEQPGRYSEDIDLVQNDAGPIGEVIDTIRATLDPWLGSPKRNQSQGRVAMIYRFETTSLPVQKMRLKVEINTREHFAVFGIHQRHLVVENPWFSGAVNVATYTVEELLGTKLRALYQRKKGRDLYDLWLALTSLGLDDGKIVKCFQRYMENGATSVSRAEFEENLVAKLSDPAFIGDMAPLLPTGINYPIADAGQLVLNRLVALLPGEPWKGTAPSEGR